MCSVSSRHMCSIAAVHSRVRELEFSSVSIHTCKRSPPGRARSKWLDQIRAANSLGSPADLWRCAVRRGHSRLTQLSRLMSQDGAEHPKKTTQPDFFNKICILQK